MKKKHYEPARPGTRLVGYSVLAEIGRGAASIIYLVQSTRSKQVYALKHIEKRDPKDQRFLDQTIQEYEIGSKIHHPAIRSIEKLIKQRQRFGSIRELFLLMEYVDGVSIEKSPPESLIDSLSVFKQTASGLAAMHDAGYVHADMKPNNIVINENNEVKIIDLGQACAVGTVKERIQGTPDYIAPEQVHRRQITPQTDIYNLGATMYWVLTKRHIPTALSSDNSLVSSLDDEMIERPAPVIDLRPDVPPQLSQLVMECVEVDPVNRPTSMHGLHEKLDLIHAIAVAAADPHSTPIVDDD